MKLFGRKEESQISLGVQLSAVEENLNELARIVRRICVHNKVKITRWRYGEKYSASAKCDVCDAVVLASYIDASESRPYFMKKLKELGYKPITQKSEVMEMKK